MRGRAGACTGPGPGSGGASLRRRRRSRGRSVRIAPLDDARLIGGAAGWVDEARHADADWAAATRRRDLIAELANRPRTTAEVMGGRRSARCDTARRMGAPATGA